MSDKIRPNFLDSLRRSLEEYDDPDKRALLSDVVNYVLDGGFSKYSRAKELISTQSVATGADGRTAKVCAELMGISENNFIKKRTQISNELYSLFGDDFFVRLSYSPLQRSLGALVHNTITGVEVFDYVNRDVVARVHWKSLEEHTDKDVYDVRDCRNELEFLKTYSLPKMWSEFKELDAGKLNYLLSLLEGKGPVRDREGLLHVLTQGID